MTAHRSPRPVSAPRALPWLRAAVPTGALLVALVALALGGGCESDAAAPPAGADVGGAPADAVPAPNDVATPLPDEDALVPDEDAAAPDVPAAAPDAADVATKDGETDVRADVEDPIPDEPFAAPIAPQDDTFAVGPYMMHTTGTSATILWEAVQEGAPRVFYGRDGADENEVAGEHAADGVPHRVVLEGLTPETVYRYRACVGETCTGELTFATAPRAGRPFRFAVYGDSRSDPPQHRAVVDTIIESRPGVVFNTGDVVAQGGREEYPEMHFEPLRRLAHSVPVYVAIGNHEWKDQASRVKNFRDYMEFPKDPDVPLQEVSYTVSWGDAFFLVMDNTLDGADIFFPVGAGPGLPLWKWLNERVRSEEARAARWRFAFFHYPPASPCQEDWMMLAATREHVIPLLREHGFHGVFVGHVHGYERHDFDGLPVFVTGGGGAGLQDERRCTGDAPSLVTLAVLHHHLTVDLTAEQAHVRAVAEDGRVFDEAVLETTAE